MRSTFVAIMAGLMLAEAVAAAEVEGIKVPDEARVGNSDLVLNGAGVRTRLFFRVYVGALYLAQKTNSAQAVIADAGAKRVAMHLLRDLTAEQVLSSLKDGLAKNHEPGDLARIEPQVKELEAVFHAVKAARKGDVILIDYLPDQGTRVTANGESKGTIAGEEFNRALLRIWLGDQPADAGLKKAMLGG